MSALAYFSGDKTLKFVLVLYGLLSELVGLY